MRSPNYRTRWREKLASGHLYDMMQQEQQALITHVATCQSCARAWAEYQAIDVAVNNLPPVRPLVEIPGELAALISKYRREEAMLKNNQYQLETQVIDPETQPARKYKRSPGHGTRRIVHMMNSIAAALIVSVIAVGALLLFTKEPTWGGFGSNRTPPETSALTLYDSVESPVLGNDTIYAVNSVSGEISWKSILTTKLTTGELRPHKGLLFAPNYDGNLYTLDAKTGKILWKYSVRNDPAPKEPTNTNAPSSPIASGDTVYFGAESGFYALDIQTGKLLWHVKPQSSCKPRQVNPTFIIPPTCSFIVGTVANGRVYVYSDGLYALDAKTGKELWHDLQFQFRGAGSVVVVGDNVYATDPSNNISILNASDGKEIKRIASVGNPSEIVKGGQTLLVDGVVYHTDVSGVQAISGTEVIWNKSYPISSLLAGSAGTLFVQSYEQLDPSKQNDNSGVYFYALDAKTGVIKWQWGEQSVDSFWSPGYPLSVDGRLYFFFPVEKDKKLFNALWILHDGKRDLHLLDTYPVKAG